MQGPPPASVRGARTLAAPTSYSYVGDRGDEPRPAPKRAERPTLPGGGTPSAPLGPWGSSKPPENMAEAIARVSPTKRAAKQQEPQQEEPEQPTTRRQEGAPLPPSPVSGQLPSTEPRPRPAPSPEVKPRTTPRPTYGRPTYGTPPSKPSPVDERPSAPDQDPSRQPTKQGEELVWDAPTSTPKPEVPASVFGLRKSTPPGPPPPSKVGIKPPVERAEPLPTAGKPPQNDDTLASAEISDADIDGMLEGLGDSVDALLDDIDAGFDRIVDGPPASGDAGLTDRETAEVRELFTQIAAGHMRPVRDFMIELELGDPPREWLDLVRPAVASLGKSAEGMSLDALHASTKVFLEAIDAVAQTKEPRISPEERKQLTQAFGVLGAELPGAFDLDEERDRREPVIVQSLLRQIPDVRKVALDKLYAAGLTSLEMYYAAKPYDVAQAAGLDEDLAERIVRRFAQYRRETSVGAPDLERTHEHKKLAVLVARLAQQNEAFDTASKSWSKKAQRDKRRVRKERTETVLEINVLLARLGALELVDQLEKLPFHGKVDALRSYLEEVKEQAAAHSGR